MKQALLDGLCAFCYQALPCEGCGIPEYELDGKGWLQPKAVPVQPDAETIARLQAMPLAEQVKLLEAEVAGAPRIGAEAEDCASP